MSVPAWWTDIVRAHTDALGSYRNVLDRLEQALDSQNDLSPRVLARSSRLWQNLLQEEQECSLRLSRVLKLSESRRLDAMRSGFSATLENDALARLARDNAERARHLKSRIRESMETVQKELLQRQSRRPMLRNFRDASSSHIDIHA